MKKATFLLIIGVISLFYISINIVYFIKFGLITSNEQDVWGQYGDFIGGSLNPLFTIALIYLTYTISKNTDDKISEGIEVERKITITQIRREAVSNMIFIMDEKNISEYQNSKDMWNKIASHLINFQFQNKYIFEKLFTDEFEFTLSNLYKSISDLTKFDFSKLTPQNEVNKEDTFLAVKEYIQLVDNYSELKISFINSINKFILEDLTVERK